MIEMIDRDPPLMHKSPFEALNDIKKLKERPKCAREDQISRLGPCNCKLEVL